MLYLSVWSTFSGHYLCPKSWGRERETVKKGRKREWWYLDNNFFLKFNNEKYPFYKLNRPQIALHVVMCK